MDVEEGSTLTRRIWTLDFDEEAVEGLGFRLVRLDGDLVSSQKFVDFLRLLSGGLPVGLEEEGADLVAELATPLLKDVTETMDSTDDCR